jgi:hypothetical protein
MKASFSVATVAIILCFLLIGCDRTDARDVLVPANVQEAAVVDRSLLTPEECTPPCWQGIVPGTTTLDDAWAIVSDLEFVDRASMRSRRNCYRDGEHCIEWETALSDWQNYVGRILIEDDVVSYIRLVLEYELTVQDLIDQYGTPNKVITSQVPNNSRYYHTDMLWFHNGLSVALDLSSQALVGSDQRVESVSYYPPTADVFTYLIDVLDMPQSEAQTEAQHYQDWDQSIHKED